MFQMVSTVINKQSCHGNIAVMDSEATLKRAGVVLEEKERAHPPYPHLLGVLSNSTKHQEKQKQQFNSQVRDLSRTLTFTKDVFPSSSPRIISSYSAAKHSARELFQPGNLRLETQHSLGSGGGRYNIRGSGIKHLPCHLEDTTTRAAGGSVGLPFSQLLVCSPKELPVIRGDDCVRQYQSFDRLYPPSTTNNYTFNLVAGARPVHPSGSTISLDNNTKYKKVLQQSYPQPPESYFVAEDRRVRKTGVRQRTTGFRRWLELPYPVKVR